CCVWATLLKPDVARSGKGNSPVPCTAWADQKWSTIPRSYLVAPHIARLMFGEDHRFYLPASALLGAPFFLSIILRHRGNL
ncbi:iron chelate uptake ABC transporter family permease subunit, partial [Sodalis sp. (in: enterobacteria)]|uniref:iron chelate uptake ABC transporter family permease subunit n=1 Tax=Sodalis sp. (in: enterobacteria) TaxID=1898979 RepID=UPI003F3DC71D